MELRPRSSTIISGGRGLGWMIVPRRSPYLMSSSFVKLQTCQVSRISRESHTFSLRPNSRFSAGLNIISRILFYLSYALISQEN